MSQSSRYLPAAARRTQILALVERRGFVSVARIAQFFGVSEVTARGDLEALAETNAVQRVHGGAVSGLTSGSLERTFDVAAGESTEEKQRIGKAAALQIGSNQMVALDVGTTTTAIARELQHRTDIEGVTVVTNALNIAIELEAAYPRMTVVVTGGTLRPSQHSLVDPLGDALLERIHADVAFIGCNGVSPEGGITNMNFPEADMKRRLLAAATRRVIVADSTKLGAIRSSRVGSLDEIDLLITGEEADPDLLHALRQNGVEVMVV